MNAEYYTTLLNIVGPTNDIRPDNVLKLCAWFDKHIVKTGCSVEVWSKYLCLRSKTAHLLIHENSKVQEQLNEAFFGLHIAENEEEQ